MFRYCRQTMGLICTSRVQVSFSATCPSTLVLSYLGKKKDFSTCYKETNAKIGANKIPCKYTDGGLPSYQGAKSKSDGDRKTSNTP